ncbi:MAG: O-antigen ligase family protein [Thermoleophilia bacterium]|nr:O-antigen ligase family protein [Thermoleophilia bacterium]
MAKAVKNRKTTKVEAPAKRAPAKGAPRPAGKEAPRPAVKETSKPAPKERADTMSMGRRIAWWALLVMVFLVPIATSNFTMFGFDQSFTDDIFDLVKVSLMRMLTLVALAAWLWDLLRRGGRIRHSPVSWAVLALVVWVAIATATSVHWPTALLGKPNRHEGLVTFIDYGVIYFLFLQFADHASRLRRLAGSLFWSSVLVSIFGIVQHLGVTFAGWQPVGFEASRAFSTFGNPDFLGGFLIFSVAVALGLAVLEQRIVWRLVYWVGFGLNGVALVVTFARGAWIGGFIALALLVVIAWRRRVKMRRVDWLPAGASLAVGVAFAVRSLSSSSEALNFGKRIASIFEFSSGSGYSRTEIWRAALSAIKDRPVFGSGPDTFRLVFHRFKTPEYVRFKGGTSGADNAHDYYLQLAAGSGIPGAVLFCGVFLWAGVKSFSTVFGRADEPARIIVGAFWAASVGYLVHLVFGLSLPGITFLLWIALAVVLVPTGRTIQVRARRLGTIAAVVVIALAAVGIGYQAVAVAADHAFQRSESASSAQARVEDVRRAAELNPLNPDYRQGLGIAYLDEMSAYLEAGARAEERGEDTTPYEKGVRRSFADAQAAIKEAIDFTPLEYDNHMLLASLYNLAGQTIDAGLYQDAIEAAEQALEIMPLGTTARIQLAQAQVATGRVAEAVKTLEHCVEIDPSGGDAAYSLASLYRQLGRVEDALSLLKSVEARLPGQPGIAEAIEELEAATSEP